MTNNITSLLQNQMRSIFQSLKNYMKEAKNIYDAYWKTDATTQVVALAADSDPATIASHLTKAEYLGGMTFVENFDNFFNNGAVVTADYYQTLIKLKYGSAGSLASELSAATEQIGTRLYNMAIELINLYDQAVDVINLYTDNEVTTAIASLADQRIVTGSDMTVDDLKKGIALLEQFINMITNTAITQASYSATLSIWDRLSNIE